jgi:hypothetical protein
VTARLTNADTGLEDYGEPIVESKPWWWEALDEGWTAQELVGDADPTGSLPWWQEALLAGDDPRGDSLILKESPTAHNLGCG